MGFDRFLLFQVVPKTVSLSDAYEGMHELMQLVETFGGSVVAREVQRRIHPHPDTYMGDGKLAYLVRFIEEKEIDVLVINDQVSAGQLYRIEQALWDLPWDVAVWDRVDLILNIFERHAQTRHATLQIALARILHLGPRNYGLGKHRLSRQGGGIGTRGLGETNVELEKRKDKERVRKIKRELSKISKQRRSIVQRRSDQGMGPVALVGYTSAGKTTLFNALTGKQKKEHAKLFTTLDTVVGKMKLPHQDKPVIISDTIGFLRDLPPELIEAFESTLYESLEAELVLHVIDAADPEMIEKITTVDEILRKLEVTAPVLRVFNKVDLLADYVNGASIADLDGVLVSAANGHGLPELKDAIQRILYAK